MHPFLRDLGVFQIYTYGFFVAVAMTVAFILIARLAPRMGFSTPALYDLVLVMFVTGVLGARMAYVFQNMDIYLQDPAQVFWLKEGGLIWYGGFIFGGFCALAYCAIKKLPILKTADFFAPLLAIGHAIGRIGCFFNGCCYGSWGDVTYWPIQLVESLFLFLLFIWLLNKLLKRHREGAIFLSYLFSYSLWRFAVEFFRGDQTKLGILTIAQWVSLVLLAGSVISFIMISRRHAKY